MSVQDSLRVTDLVVENFRCFRECSVDFHPSLTVIAADNGRGKTAILDALSIALGLYVDVLTDSHNPTRFERSDIRLASPSESANAKSEFTSVYASGLVDGGNIRWRRSISSIGSQARTTTKDARDLMYAANHVAARLSKFASDEGEVAPPLPLVALYGTGRLWSEHRLTSSRRSAAVDVSRMGRVAGYVDCLSPSSSFKAFATWYGETYATVAGTHSLGYDRVDRPQLLLSAVNEATNSVLSPTGWSGLGWDTEAGGLAVEHPAHGRVPVSLLSDGVKSVTALVADIAHRCVRLNPHFGGEAARLCPGVVMIDEVDMHLHPSWQQKIIGLLTEAFPKVQFILTTHSPQVISTVKSESVRVLSAIGEVAEARSPRFQTRGVESSEVLARVMEVDPIPQVEEAEWVSRYRALLQAGQHQSAAGKSFRERIVEHFQDDHPVMQELATLERLYAFKNMRGFRTEG